MKPTKLQTWLRTLSGNLYNSFSASACIEHKVTKGASREHQVLDVLRLLPAALEVDRDAVIIDSRDTESPKFDGILFDRSNWPLLFQDEGTRVVMLESVFAAIETKSIINAAEMKDSFSKGGRLRTMHYSDRSNTQFRPLFVVFGYACPNVSLSFFDFCRSFSQSPAHSPGLFAILNVGLFAFRTESDGMLAALPRDTDMPIFLTTGEDTLLALLYHLCAHTSRPPVADVLKDYSKSFFSGVPSFRFDSDFICMLRANNAMAEAARNCFARRPNDKIVDLYAEARKAANL